MLINNKRKVLECCGLKPSTALSLRSPRAFVTLTPRFRYPRECGVLFLFCIYAFKPTPLRWVGLLNNPHRKKKTHAAQCMGFKTNPLTIATFQPFLIPWSSFREIPC